MEYGWGKSPPSLQPPRAPSRPAVAYATPSPRGMPENFFEKNSWTGHPPKTPALFPADFLKGQSFKGRDSQDN